MDASDSELYYKVTGSSREGCNISSMQPAIKDDLLCSHNRRNISGGISEVVARQCIETTWVAKEYSIGQRTTVCGKVDQGVK